MPTIQVGLSQPFTTIPAALASLPSVLVEPYTLALDAGAYPDPVVLDQFFTAGRGRVVLSAPATIGPVTATGLTVELRDVTVQAGGASIGVILTQATAFLNGSVTVSGWTFAGVLASYHSRIGKETPGALTLSGAGTGSGLHMVNNSQCAIYSNGPQVAIVITNVVNGFAIAFNSAFTHQGPSGSISVVNSTAPANSAGVLLTDLSSWSTPNPLTMTNLTRRCDLNSICYLEATGPKTLSNAGVARATQNSILWWP